MNKSLYIYESHLDGLYASDKKLDLRACEVCGDSDSFYYFTTRRLKDE